MANIPAVSDPGVTGLQEPGPTTLPQIDSLSPTHGLPIAEAIEGIAASNPKKFGGEVPAALVAGAMAQVSHELRRTQRTLEARDDLIQRLQSELTEAKVESAKLSERLGALSTVQRLKQFSIFAGTAVLGVAASLYPTNAEKTSYVLAAIGAGLLAFGWLTTKPGGDE